MWVWIGQEDNQVLAASISLESLESPLDASMTEFRRKGESDNETTVSNSRCLYVQDYISLRQSGNRNLAILCSGSRDPENWPNTQSSITTNAKQLEPKTETHMNRLDRPFSLTRMRLYTLRARNTTSIDDLYPLRTSFYTRQPFIFCALPLLLHNLSESYDDDRTWIHYRTG